MTIPAGGGSDLTSLLCLAAWTCRLVSIKVRYPDFTTLTRAHSFDVPTTSAERIESCAIELLRRTDAAERSVRLLGLSVEGLAPAQFEQYSLFDRQSDDDDGFSRAAEPISEYGGEDL